MSDSCYYKELASQHNPVSNIYTMPTRDLSRIHEAIINNPEGVALVVIDYYVVVIDYCGC